MNTLQIKEIIREKEENSWNCGGRLCDYFVKVVNLRERKNFFLVDVIVKEQDNTTQRFNDCEYNKKIFDLK